jgi:ADP-ribose pyrophosphatase YjhB (NUDIX family)
MEKKPGKKNSHCGYCGAPFADGQAWPRQCAACGATTFQNPLPVAVVLLPVDGGVLCIRRGIPPHVGSLALPGGYINLGESWQAAAARELDEETGIRVDPDGIGDFKTMSAPDGTVLIFGVARAVKAADLPPFEPTNETTERVVVPAPTELAFPLHTRALAEYFARR